MKSLAIVLMLTSLLLAACGITSAPLEQQPVTLQAMGEDTEVPLYKEWDTPFLDEIARLPSGTVCTLLATVSWERGHGQETVTLYQVDCDGTVGWAGEASVIFAPGESTQ